MTGGYNQFIDMTPPPVGGTTPPTNGSNLPTPVETNTSFGNAALNVNQSGGKTRRGKKHGGKKTRQSKTQKKQRGGNGGCGTCGGTAFNQSGGCLGCVL